MAGEAYEQWLQGRIVNAIRWSIAPTSLVFSARRFWVDCEAPSVIVSWGVEGSRETRSVLILIGKTEARFLEAAAASGWRVIEARSVADAMVGLEKQQAPLRRVWRDGALGAA